MHWELGIYGCELLRDAAKHTWASIRNHVLAALLVVVLLPVALFLLLFSFPQLRTIMEEQAVINEAVIALAGLVALVLVILIFGFWNLAYSPLRKQQAVSNNLASARAKVAEMRRRLKPILRLSLEEGPVGTHGTPGVGGAGRFWRIKVENEASAAAKRCYGEFVECLLLTENGKKRNRVFPLWPLSGHRLPWARQSGGTFECDIPGRGTAYLDYAMVPDARRNMVSIPSQPDATATRPEYLTYFLGAGGRHEVEIAIGSLEQDFERSTIRFWLEFQGNYNLTVVPIQDKESPRD